MLSGLEIIRCLGLVLERRRFLAAGLFPEPLGFREVLFRLFKLAINVVVFLVDGDQFSIRREPISRSLRVALLLTTQVLQQFRLGRVGG